MSLSMYDITVPTYTVMLINLKAILVKAKAHAEQHRFDPNILLEMRLFPDMFNLKRQVQAATDHACGLARLTDVEVPDWPRTEQTLDELTARIDRAIDFIKSIPQEKFAGAEDREVAMNMGPREFKFTGLQFQQRFNQGNFYFHVTTAYAILRHNGIVIGKRDYLG